MAAINIVMAVCLVFNLNGISDSASEGPVELVQKKTAAEPATAQYDLPVFTIATNDADPHFAKIIVSLKYEASEELNAELASRSDQIRHIINILLSGKSFKELKGNDSRATTEKMSFLAREILNHINVVLIAGKVTEVIFKEYIVN